MNILISIISLINPNRFENNTYDVSNVCNLSTVDACLTNIPVVKVLENKLNKQVDKIIAISSKQVCNDPIKNLDNITTLKYFTNEVISILGKDVVTVVKDFNENGKDKDLGVIIEEICSHIDSNDEVYIDTTGGARKVANIVQLLTKILSYKGVKNPCSYYSNLKEQNYSNLKEQKKGYVETTDNFTTLSEIADATNLFAITGRTDKLENAFEKEEITESLANLFKTMRDFNNQIQLCSVNDLENTLISMSTAIDEFVKNENSKNKKIIILKELIPVIKNKFFGNIQYKGINYKKIIAWCLENNLIQQAITITEEKLPVYLYSQNKFEFDSKKEISFINSSKKNPLASNEISKIAFYELMQINKNIQKNTEINNYKANINEFKKLLMNEIQSTKIDVVKKAYTIYKNIEIKFDSKDVSPTLKKLSDSSISEYKRCANILMEVFNKSHAKKIDKFKNFLNTQPDSIRQIIEIVEEPKVNNLEEQLDKQEDERKNSFVNKLKSAENFKNNPEYSVNGFTLHISNLEMSKIIYGYIYVKAMRNTINHASNDENLTEDQKRILQREGYVTDTFDVDTISNNIKNLLDLC